MPDHKHKLVATTKGSIICAIILQQTSVCFRVGELFVLEWESVGNLEFWVKTVDATCLFKGALLQNDQDC